MGYVSGRKRQYEDRRQDSKPKKPSKRPRKQRHYHSSSSGSDVDSEQDTKLDGADFKGVDLNDSDSIGGLDNDIELPNADASAAAPAHESDEDAVISNAGASVLPAADANDSQASEETGASSISDSDTSSVRTGTKRKRNDPDAFATSISKILGSKLTTSKRSDPVLSRSKSAAAAGQELSEAKLEAKARRKLREDKKTELDKGRVRDVLGVEDSGSATAAETLEVEKKLRKTAQRGVVKLFNAVRAAQVKGEQAARDAKRSGVVGSGRREKQVNDMSKQGFLDLIAGGGLKGKAEAVEEA